MATADTHAETSNSPVSKSETTASRLLNPDNPTQTMTVTEIFGPRFRGAVIELEYQLQTHRMKQFFKRDFKYLSQMFYAIETYRQISGVDSARLDQVEESVGTKMDAVRKLLQRMTKEGTALIEVNGYGQTPISYPSPLTFTAPIISPFAKEYLDILVVADGAFMALHKAHLLGLTATKEKYTREASYRKAVRSIAESVRTRRIEMLKYIQALRTNADDSDRQIIDETMSQEAKQLTAQVVEEPELQGSISVEAEVTRIAAAHAESAHTESSTPAATTPAATGG